MGSNENSRQIKWFRNHTSVINVVSIKPFDTECVKRLAEKVECFVTVEEHNIIGGLGSIIADAMVDAGVIKPLIRIGLPDIFAKGYGTISDVRKRNNLECDDIVKKDFGEFAMNEYLYDDLYVGQEESFVTKITTQKRRWL